MSNYAVADMARRLADELARAAEGTPQKVIAARSGLGSDQVSKILSGDTEDPRWSTMVKLVRDGLGVSLDDFAGGRADKTLTPYDSNPEYREMIDNLEELTDRDRSKVADFVRWLAASLAEHGSRDAEREQAHGAEAKNVENVRSGTHSTNPALRLGRKMAANASPPRRPNVPSTRPLSERGKRGKP